MKLTILGKSPNDLMKPGFCFPKSVTYWDEEAEEWDPCATVFNDKTQTRLNRKVKERIDQMAKKQGQGKGRANVTLRLLAWGKTRLHTE